MNVDRLRQRTKQKVQEFEAIAVFTNQLDQHNSSELSKVRSDLKSVSSKKLREILLITEGHIATLKKKSGFTADISLLVKMVKDARENAPRILTLPKWYVDGLFKSYGRCFVGWETIPPHGVFPFDGTGDIKKAVWHGIYLPEAILYEDMCASYNLAVRSHAKRYAVSSSKVEIKTHDMAVRTSILAGYYFVEAYLNAMAFDHWWRQQATLTQDDIDLLLEWDSKRKRQRWLSLEDKTNRYPRIILGLQHSPLAPSNCEELKYLLTSGKKLRDSIVHASPKIDPETNTLAKLTHMLGAQVSDATLVVDASILYVRRLNGLLGAHGCDLDWLKDRDASGQFPNSAFG